MSCLALVGCGSSPSDADTSDTTDGSDTSLSDGSDTSEADLVAEDVDTADATADTGDADPADATADTGDADTADTTPDPWAHPSSSLAVSVQTWVGGTARTSLGGALRAGPMPTTYVVAATTAECRLLLGENPFCDPFCDGTLCTAPNVCTPFPALLSAGTLTLSSPGTRAVVLEPDVTGYGASFESQVFADGAPITFTAAGDEVPTFTATLTAPPTMVANGLDGLSLKSPLVFDWEAPATPLDTRVLIRLQADRGQHGRALSAILECDVPDDGHFEIPASLQSQYVADDLWGCGKCPASSITRYTSRRLQAGPHDLELRVESSSVFLLTTWTNAQ